MAKNEKLIELMKYELGGKIMTEFVGLWRKRYFYLIGDYTDEKKANGTKNA